MDSTAVVLFCDCGLLRELKRRPAPQQARKCWVRNPGISRPYWRQERSGASRPMRGRPVPASPEAAAESFRGVNGAANGQSGSAVRPIRPAFAHGSSESILLSCVPHSLGNKESRKAGKESGVTGRTEDKALAAAEERNRPASPRQRPARNRHAHP